MLSRNNEIYLIARKEFLEGVLFAVRTESSIFWLSWKVTIFTSKHRWILQYSHLGLLVPSNLQASWKLGYRPTDIVLLLCYKFYSFSSWTGDWQWHWYDDSFVCECVVHNINTVHNDSSNALLALIKNWDCETREGGNSSLQTLV